MSNVNNVRIIGPEINFGNLKGLVGTWKGANGFNMIAVPNQKGEFTLLVAPYTETLIINAVPATTPNRGLTVIENIPTLQYATTITDSRDNSLMHVECGFWESLQFSTRNAGFDIFRIASVPHGDAVEAMGNSFVSEGPPAIDPLFSGLPTGDLPDASGYIDGYLFPFEFPDFNPAKPNQTLINYLAQQEAKHGLKVTNTVTLAVSTQNKGGINNIASLQTNANPVQFDAIFWLETVEDANGNITQQLQYSQRIMIEFPIKSDLSGQTITWPHINVNSLTLSV
jgi:hypothetical protein